MKDKIKEILDNFVEVRVKEDSFEINSNKLAEMILREFEREVKQNGDANFE